MLGGHPVGVDLAPGVRIPRGRPLVNWLLAFPLLFELSLVSVGAVVVVVVSWFAIVCTGRMPGWLGDYVMGVLRYGWRVGLPVRAHGPLLGFSRRGRLCRPSRPTSRVLQRSAARP
jgi:hypothetical protein